MNARGFTLLELIVALGVFAVIGLISAQLLSHSIKVTDRVLDRSGQLIEIQRALSVIQRDLEQHIGRPIRNQFGDREESIELRSTTEIEFTRTGWSNPLKQHRSRLQRVSYFVADNQLIRRFWYVLDRPYEPKYREQVVLANVSALHFNVVDESGQKFSSYPPRAAGQLIEHHSLVAVTITLGTLAYGELKWLVMIPEAPLGFQANPS